MTKRVLGVGAVAGNADDPQATDESTIQPGLVDAGEKAGATLKEQAAADLRAEKRAAKAAEKETENNG